MSEVAPAEIAELERLRQAATAARDISKPFCEDQFAGRTEAIRAWEHAACNLTPRLAADLKEAKERIIELDYATDAVHEYNAHRDTLAKLAAAEARVAKLEALCREISQWDHLASAGDGAYWRKRLDAALRGEL